MKEINKKKFLIIATAFWEFSEKLLAVVIIILELIILLNN